jgi:hypothetical protein
MESYSTCHMSMIVWWYMIQAFATYDDIMCINARNSHIWVYIYDLFPAGVEAWEHHKASWGTIGAISLKMPLERRQITAVRDTYGTFGAPCERFYRFSGSAYLVKLGFVGWRCGHNLTGFSGGRLKASVKQDQNHIITSLVQHGPLFLGGERVDRGRGTSSW